MYARYADDKSVDVWVHRDSTSTSLAYIKKEHLLTHIYTKQGVDKQRKEENLKRNTSTINVYTRHDDCTFLLLSSSSLLLCFLGLFFHLYSFFLFSQRYTVTVIMVRKSVWLFFYVQKREREREREREKEKESWKVINEKKTKKK